MSTTSELFIANFVICFVTGFIFTISIGRAVIEFVFVKEPETSIPAIIVGWICVFGMCLFFNGGHFSEISPTFYPPLFISVVLFYLLARLVGSK